MKQIVENIGKVMKRRDIFMIVTFLIFIPVGMHETDRLLHEVPHGWWRYFLIGWITMACYFSFEKTRKRFTRK
ncbi:MAG: hypothetical protein LBS09_01435 [Bacteroidales bacterium]|jgi:hypothetical protein|nr:hypothetical protein [Bacteroidales bacterium]